MIGLIPLALHALAQQLAVAAYRLGLFAGAALIGYAALRFQLWRMRRNGGAAMSGPFGPIMAQMDAVMRARRQGR